MLASTAHESPIWAEIDSAGMNWLTIAVSGETASTAIRSAVSTTVWSSHHELALAVNPPFWTKSAFTKLVNLMPEIPDAESWAVSLSEHIALGVKRAPP